METFTFIKITNLPAYLKVFIRNSIIDEVITKLSATLGATIKFDAATTNSSYSIRTQCKEIIRHVAYKKPFSSSVFMFYACIKEEQGNSNTKCPKQFLITEPHVEPDTLQCDLTTWQCLHAEGTQVKHKTAYIKLNTIIKKHHYHQGNV